MSASSGNDHARPRQYSGGKGECVKGGRREDVAERGVASIGVRWLFGLANLGERRHLACTTSRSLLYNICTLEHTRTQPRLARAASLRVLALCVCLLLQYLLQSCSRGGGGGHNNIIRFLAFDGGIFRVGWVAGGMGG